MQSSIMSFVEAWANVAIGFSINWVANMLILPLFGLDVSAGQAFWVGVCFTGISVVRSYCLRRWFNGFGGKR